MKYFNCIYFYLNLLYTGPPIHKMEIQKAFLTNESQTTVLEKRCHLKRWDQKGINILNTCFFPKLETTLVHIEVWTLNSIPREGKNWFNHVARLSDHWLPKAYAEYNRRQPLQETSENNTSLQSCFTCRQIKDSLWTGHLYFQVSGYTP